MSNQDPNPEVQKLLQEGIKAAREGDTNTARKLLEQVVEQDQYSEKGWFWLAAVVETTEEKRVCLGNVVVINPDNQRAQRLLERLEEGEIGDSKRGKSSGDEGVSKSSVRLAIGLGAVAVIALLVVLVIAVGGGGNDNESTPQANNATTSEGVQAQETPETGTQQITETVIFQPTLTLTPTLTPLPPTWTPVPSPTPIDTNPTTPLAPPPSGLTGTIIMRSGQVAADPYNQPIAIIQPDGTGYRIVSPEGARGHAPVLSPKGQRFAYVRFATGTRENVLQHAPLDGIGDSWNWTGAPYLYYQDTPDWSLDGAWIAFTASGSGAEEPDLYRVSIVAPGETGELQRLTSDKVIESWPAFSPDGTEIVYVSDFTETGDPIVELQIINLETMEIRRLTHNGSGLIESAPDWSPDGRTIIFQAQEAGSEETDIFQVPANGEVQPIKIIDSDSMDSQPRYSPDGRYIVFSSNRTRNWDVFVYEIASQTIFQVTTDARTDIANGWGP
ncbi:MAG: PD40 domain-containing protein [Anaerolineae bacterium]|nr:PD40 domain-containing protein [Anaerolineae bacterium]